MATRVLFLTLRTFSLTGGIEKVCRSICRVLFDLSETSSVNPKVYCMYDKDADRDSRYLSKTQFKGFSENRKHFVWKSLITGFKSDVIILSHIHLLNIGYLIKKIKPAKRVYLLAHGIEIWRKLPEAKLKRLRSLDKIICVSQFTSDKIRDLHQIPISKLSVLNNCLDPFFHVPTIFEKPEHLLNRYDINENQQVIFSLSRVSSSEKYKGYDHTIQVIPNLLKHFPNLIYLLGGKWDKQEKKRLDELIQRHNLKKHVKLIGFVDEGELTEHFLLSDIFTMPSKKEGFGIVFIEAIANGLQVVAGSKDGSVDALLHGRLGALVDPDNFEEIEEKVLYFLKNPLQTSDKKRLQKDCMKVFGYTQYKMAFESLLLLQDVTGRPISTNTL